LKEDLDIVIVVYNSIETIQACLDSLEKEIACFNSKVFIVDNKSSDASAKIIKKYYRHFHLIQNTTNLGFGKANNQAINLCEGKYILMLNPDTVLIEGCINKLIIEISKSATIAVVGPKIFNLDGTIQESALHFPNIISEFMTATYLYLIVKRIPYVNNYFGYNRSPKEKKKLDSCKGRVYFGMPEN